MVYLHFLLYNHRHSKFQVWLLLHKILGKHPEREDDMERAQQIEGYIVAQGNIQDTGRDHKHRMVVVVRIWMFTHFAATDNVSYMLILKSVTFTDVVTPIQTANQR